MTVINRVGLSFGIFVIGLNTYFSAVGGVPKGKESGLWIIDCILIMLSVIMFTWDE